MRPNTRVQRTRSSPSAPHSPLTRCPLGAAGTLFRSIAIAFASAQPVSACSCVRVPAEDGLPEMDFLLKASDTVFFVGTVVSVESLAPAQELAAYPESMHAGIRQLYGSKATFRVDRYWSGMPVGSTFVVETANVGGACGVPWRVGDCFLVDAWPEEGVWKSSTCSSTAKVELAADDLTWL